MSKSCVRPGFTASEYNAHLTSGSDAVVGSLAGGGASASAGSSFGFSFSNVTSLDVVRAVGSIRSNSVGLDNVPLVFVKMILPFVLPVLTHIVNYCLTSSSVPRAWKLSKVLPVHKKTRFRGLDDFCPISIIRKYLRS